MANNNQQPDRDQQRQAQPGRPTPDDGREDMERPERDEDRIERERRQGDKRPQ